MSKQNYIHKFSKPRTIYICIFFILLPFVLIPIAIPFSILTGLIAIPMSFLLVVGLYDKLIITNDTIIIKKFAKSIVKIPVKNVFKLDLKLDSKKIEGGRFSEYTKTYIISLKDIEGKTLGKIPLEGWDNDEARERIKKELRLRGNRNL